MFQATSDSVTTTVAPFALLRVAALPYEELFALTPAHISNLIQYVFNATNELESLRPQIENALHHLIQNAEKRARSELLTLRRDVHNGRRPSIQGIDSDQAFEERYRSPRPRSLATWLEVQQHITESLESIDRTLTEKVSTDCVTGLASILKNEAFRQPLAIASPSLFRRLVAQEQTVHSGKPDRRLRRSLFSYAIRAAAKTSPFSTFLHHAILDKCMGESQFTSFSVADLESQSYLSRGAVLALRNAALGCCGRKVHASFVLNPSIEWLPDDRAVAFVSTNIVFARRQWRSERRAQFRFHPRVASQLRSLPELVSWRELLNKLTDTGLTSESADALATRLWEGGIIILAPHSDASDCYPELPFLDALGKCVTPEAVTILANVKRMSSIASEMAIASSANRILLIDSFADLYTKTWKCATADPQPPSINAIHDQSYFTQPFGWLSKPVHELVEEAGATLRSYTAVKRPYSFLRNYFIDTFGAGGVAEDIPAFLATVANEFMGARRQDIPETSSRSNDLKLPVSTLLQFAAESTDDLNSGNALVVINKVYSGCGWLSARHARGNSPAQKALHSRLHEWLRQIYHPREPVAIPVCGECDDLQAHPGLTEQVLIWPTEPMRTGRQILAKDVLLSHNEVTDLLELSIRGAPPIAPVYLGGIIPTPSLGARYWLTLLACPYEVRLSSRWIPPVDLNRHYVEHRPRRTEGRTVLARAEWYLSTENLRQRWYRRSGSHQLLDVAEFSNELKMPRIVFARLMSRSARVTDPIAHKPLWIDTWNPLCLEILQRMLRGGDWIVLTEALPDANTLWTTLDGRRHVAELLIEMVI